MSFEPSISPDGPPPRVRVDSIDLVRGLVIILMALDHVHDFFGDIGLSPTDLTRTTAGLFFTRWITHLCAPTFFFLTGVSACLTLRRMTRTQLAGFLAIRGAWLIFLEVVVVRFALQFNVDYRVTALTVLWGLGWAMIVLAALVRFPGWISGAFGGILILGHNLLDGVQPASFGSFAPVWNLLHVPGIVFDNGRCLVLAAYVLLPWVGVTALGYAAGRIYEWEPECRRKLLLRSGLGCVLAFGLLRLANGYGDPVPWSHQATGLWTLMSFLNLNKYPPSLLFLLMTLGPMLLLLRAFDGSIPGWARPALLIGKVPLFFFVLHFYLIHSLAVAAAWIRYRDASGLFRSPDLAHFPFTPPPGWPAGLPTVYLLWVAVVLALYPLCRWFAGVKRRRTDWWLSYL